MMLQLFWVYFNGEIERPLTSLPNIAILIEIIIIDIILTHILKITFILFDLICFLLRYVGLMKYIAEFSIG